MTIVTPETAALLRVMISSPGDMYLQANLAERLIYRWNHLHSLTQNPVALLPLSWQYDAVPRVGAGDAQEVINHDLLDRAHILITLFGHRIGTATDRAISGTVEEIERALDRGMSVHVFFSEMPMPHDVDVLQLEAVRKYEEQIRPMGLIGYFSSENELENLITRCLDQDVVRIVGGTSSVRAEADGAIIRVSISSSDTVSVITIRNEGNQMAEDVKFAAVLSPSKPVAFLNQGTPVNLSPGEGYNYSTRTHFPPESKLVVSLTWREGRIQKESRLELGGS